MTTVIMDADSLIKITKAGAKEVACKHLNLIVPPYVQDECVKEGTGCEDAVIIERNINDNRLRVVPTTKDARIEKEIASLGLGGGEQDVYRLSLQTPHDFISSDDQKFLRLLHQMHKKAITSSALLVLLYKQKKISSAQALSLLEDLKTHISPAEYDLSKNTLGGRP